MKKKITSVQSLYIFVTYVSIRTFVFFGMHDISASIMQINTKLIIIMYPSPK